ncbi:MAG: glycoside hydrolase family 127 protein, partial [Clostridia bacterium]|nr:glycoside hydrolase family 127 protein [Clostridia bacterium]
LLSLRAQLLSRCAALCPQAGEESIWYGGTLPGGRQAADLLDAMLLCSALLSDQELRDHAMRLALMIARSQREDGSFGAPDETFAARGAMLRALMSAYGISGDKQLLTFMLRYMKYLRDDLLHRPLSAEDALHTGDTLKTGVFLYNVTGQKAILSVLTMLIAQGADYTSLFHTFPYRTPVTRTVSSAALKEALAREGEDGYYHHLLRTASAENLCEGLRTAALSGLITGSGKHLSAPEVGLTRMMKAHGAPCGGLTGAPLLAGRNPAAGVSAASLCQLADSLETLLSCPDGEHVADQLETLVYNGLYAAFAADDRGVQCVQQGNQTRISREPRFDMTGDDANLFTCDDGETLCALLAALPRFAQSQWLLSRDGGLCAIGYAPCTLRYRLGDTAVRLSVAGDYPHSGAVRITLHLSGEAAFPLHLRIPAWAAGATAAVSGSVHEGTPGKFLTINREWRDGDEILLNLPMTVERIDCYHQSVSVARGPLRFVHAPAYETGVTEEGYALMDAKEGFGIALCLGAAFDVVTDDDGSVVLKTRAVALPRWKMKGASCAQPPIALDETGAEFDVTLVPYAKAAIRLAVLPQA